MSLQILKFSRHFLQEKNLWQVPRNVKIAIKYFERSLHFGNHSFKALNTLILVLKPLNLLLKWFQKFFIGIPARRRVDVGRNGIVEVTVGRS